MRVTLLVLWIGTSLLVGWGMIPNSRGFEYWSPDEKVVLRIDRAFMGHSDVFLVGAKPAAPDELTDMQEETVHVGAFQGPWPRASIAWTDATTVNVCPLTQDPKAKTAVNILVTERTRQLYRITTDCTKARRAPRIAPGS